MYCKKCGKEIPDGTSVCQNCSAIISISNQPQQINRPIESKKSKNRSLWIVIAFVVIMVVAAILLISIFGENSSLNSSDEKSDSKKESVSDDVYEENYENNIYENNIVVHKDVTLVEMTSTGQIPYDKFAQGSYNEYSLYDVYDMGEYRDYIDEDCFPYEYNGKVGYCDVNGNVLISEKYNYGTFFYEGKAFVRLDSENWQIIDKTGEVLLDIPSEYSGYRFEKAYFRDGKAILGGSTVLIINEQMQCETVELPTNGVCEKLIRTKEFSGLLTNDYERNSENEKYILRLYDLSGNLLWSTELSMSYGDLERANIIKMREDIFYRYYYSWDYDVFDFINAKNGYINVFDENQKWGLMDLKTGQMVIPYKYDYVGMYSDGVVPVCSYDKWGCVDINDNVVINPAMEYVGEFINDRAFAKNESDGWVVIDKKGNVISEYSNLGGEVENVYTFSQETGVAVTKIGALDGGHHIITSTGQTLTGAYTEEICVMNNYIFFNGKMYKIEQ